MSLSDKIMISAYVHDEDEIIHKNKVKEFIKELIDKGEIMKNGAFIINYKELMELAGKDLI